MNQFEEVIHIFVTDKSLGCSRCDSMRWKFMSIPPWCEDSIYDISINKSKYVNVSCTNCGEGNTLLGEKDKWTIKRYKLVPIEYMLNN